MNDMRKLIDCIRLNESVNIDLAEKGGVRADVPLTLIAKIGLYLDDPYGDGI